MNFHFISIHAKNTHLILYLLKYFQVIFIKLILISFWITFF